MSKKTSVQTLIFILGILINHSILITIPWLTSKMVKEIIAHEQVTIITQWDAYIIIQSINNYIFSTYAKGEILNSIFFIW